MDGRRPWFRGQTPYAGKEALGQIGDMPSLDLLSRLDLPMASRLTDLAALLGKRGTVVLKAEPGAGKTSLAPFAAAAAMEAAGRGGKVIVLEPRRVAAVQAAWRAAELAGEKPGHGIGYRVRGEARAGSGIEFVTEGVFLRMIQSDPGLEGVSAVIFDEFHERSLNADLSLAFALEARKALRPDLALVLMSATLDPGRLAAFIGGDILEVEGRSFPVETRYRSIADGPRFEEELAMAAAGLLEEIEGDLLVFLPGMREIERMSRALEARLGTGPASPRVLPLHGSLPIEAQRRVILPEGEARRVILATSVAETSLTVPRIAAVLDSGLARLSRFEAGSGLNRLVTELESRDRADQRRGRAGRLGPGLCLRAFAGEGLLPDSTPPEIRRAELSGLVLEAAAWGAREASGLPWLDEPPESAWSAARALLAEIGLVDGSGAATEAGRLAASLGTEPRLAAMVLHGAALGDQGLREAAALAALLADRGPGEADLETALVAVRRGDPAYARVREDAARLEAGARSARQARAGSGAAPRNGAITTGELLAAGFPDRVARRVKARGTDADFQMPGGRVLTASGSLAAAEWIVVAEADAGLPGGRKGPGRIYAGAVLSEAAALAALAPLIKEGIDLEWQGLVPRARRRKSAGAILLSESALAAPPVEVVSSALAGRVAREGLGILPWEEKTGGETPAALLSRMRWYARYAKPEGWTGLSDAELGEGAASWLAPFAASPGPAITAEALANALRALPEHAAFRRFEREAPRELELPSGRSARLAYDDAASGPGSAPVGPLVEGRPSDFYGLSSQPEVLGIPVVIRLLSPAGRPIHTTSDLPGFWRGAWAELRKELRGRYPKHDWPEDPASARPSTRSLKPRPAPDRKA